MNKYKLEIKDWYTFGWKINSPQTNVVINNRNEYQLQLITNTNINLGMECIYQEECFTFFEPKPQIRDIHNILNFIDWSVELTKVCLKQESFRKYIDMLHPREDQLSKIRMRLSTSQKQYFYKKNKKLAEETQLTEKDNLLFLNIFKKTLANRLAYDGILYLFHYGSKINHSCSPNSEIYLINNKLIIVQQYTLKKGTEVTISYVNKNLPKEQKSRKLSEEYGVLCWCNECNE